MSIEKLKAMRESYSWDYEEAICALAPELIALWEAVDKETQGCGLVEHFIPAHSIKAVCALNAKAKEVLG